MTGVFRLAVTALGLIAFLPISRGEVFAVYDGLRAKELEWVGASDGFQIALEGAPRSTASGEIAFYILVRNPSPAPVKYVTPNSVGSTSNIWSAAVIKDGKSIKKLDWSDEIYSEVAAVMTMPVKAVHVYRVELSRKQFDGIESADAVLRVTYTQPPLAAEAPITLSVERRLSDLLKAP